MSSFVDLIKVFEGFNGTSIKPDMIRWKHNSDGQFSVRRSYKKEAEVGTQIRFGPWKVWGSVAPTKVKCFTWLVSRRACLMRFSKMWNFHIASRCILWCETRETNNHIFLYCKFTAQLWSLFLELTKVKWVMKWVMPEHTIDLLSCWIWRGVASVGD